MKAWWIGVLLAVLGMAGHVAAGETEMSLLATGTVDVGADGRVAAYALDNPDKLPPVVRKLMDQAAASWRFEPAMVQGSPVPARTGMTLRFLAKESGKDGYEVGIVSADFRVVRPPEHDVGLAAPLAPPAYPIRAARDGVRGTVYVVARVGRDGQVLEAFAEQVNLRAPDLDIRANAWRSALAGAALKAASTWSFRPPTQGPEADDESWNIRVPVEFMVHGDRLPRYGQWDLYVPGPRQRAPWVGQVDGALGADAIAAGGIYPIGGGLRLLTPLSGS